MKMCGVFVLLGVMGILVMSGTVAAQVPYTLMPGATFQEGCLAGPCLCPVGPIKDVTGTFSLTETGSDPLFTSYRLDDIFWTVIESNGEAAHQITGQGTYRLGGEFALMHQLTLDINIDAGGPVQLDSGLIQGGSEFPDISIPVSRGTLCVTLRISVSASPLEGDFPIGTLENPMSGRKVSGISTIYGWALDKKGITKVELFIDGQFVGNIPYGGTRADIERLYPTYPNAGSSGFAMAWNYFLLSSGDHSIKVRLHNQDGLAKDLDALVTVVKFQGDFVEKMIPAQRWLRKNAVTADGITQHYDIKIEWSEETQSFEITDVIKR